MQSAHQIIKSRSPIRRFNHSPISNDLPAHIGTNGFVTCRKGYDITGEGLHCYTVLFIQSGAMELSYLDNQYLLEKGQIVIINTWNKVRLKEITGPLQYAFLNVAGLIVKQLYELCYQKGFRSVTVSSVNTVQKIFKSIYDSSCEGTEAADFKAFSLLSQLLFLIFETIDRQIRYDHQPFFPVWCRKILLYIQDNYASPVIFQTICKENFVNPSLFSREFKKVMHITPTEYVNHLRIENAKDLLLQTDMTVDSIAQQVGFSNTSRFIQKFKLENDNITPSNYRRNSRGN